MKSCPACREILADEAMFCPVDGTPLSRAPGDPLVGTVLADRFLALEAVGKGASGTVYRVEDLPAQAIVALKVLHAHLGGGEAALTRYRQALAALAEMPDEHLTRLIDAGRVPDGRLFVAMEWLDGETLAQKLARHGRLIVAQAIDVVAQVADALAETHARGWCHGDLRPANLFLVDRPGRPGFVKLLDLGLAHLVRESIGAAPALTLGDARYVAPEQARREPADPRTDVYALGVVLYEAIVGQPPFGGAQVFELLQQHASAPPPRPSERVPGVPAHVEAALQRALAKQREARWPTLGEFVAALRGTAGRAAAPAEPAAPAPPEPSPAPAPAAPAAEEPRERVEGEVFRPSTAPYISVAADEAGTPLPGTLMAPEVAPAPRAPIDPSRVKTSPVGRARTVTPVHARRMDPAAASRGRVVTRNMPILATDAVSGESESPTSDDLVEEPEQQDPAGVSSVWFGEGEAASRAVEGRPRRATGSLPALYERLHEEEGHARAASSNRRLMVRFAGAGIGVAAAALAALALVGRDSGAPSGAQRRAPVENPLAPPVLEPPPAAAQPAAAVPEPVFQPFPRALPPQPAAAPGEAAPPAAEPPREARPARAPARPAPPPAARAARPAAAEPAPRDGAAEAERLVAAGRAELRSGGYAQAEEAFAKARALDADNVEAIAGLGEIAFEQGEYAQAVERLKAALRGRPRSVRYLVLLGNAYFKLGSMRAAVETYRRALDIDPHNDEAQGGLQAAERKMEGG